MKPLLSLPELIVIISDQKNGTANAAKHLAKYNPMYKALWLLMAKTKGKNLDDSSFKKKAFRKLHDKEAVYDEKIMNQLLNKLRDFLELFFKANQTNTAIGQKKLADTLRKYGHTKLADKINIKAIELAKKETKAIQHYINSEVEKDKYNSDKEKYAESLQISRLECKRYFLIVYFESAIEELNTCRIKGTKVAVSTKKELETTLLLVPEDPIPLIKVQAQTVTYFLNPSVDAYWAFREVFFENVDYLDSYKSDLLTSLINAIATYPNITDEMGQDYLVLFRFGIDNFLFIKNGEIPYWEFDNVVYIAQSRGDFSLIDKAIDAFKNIISGERSKERRLAIAKAYLHFGKKEYTEAIEILTETDKDNYLPYYLVLRKYMLGFKCAYEESSNKYNAVAYMDFKAGSFRSMLANCLTRKQINISHKTNCLNFLNLLYKMADQENPENTKQSLEHQLEQYEGAILESTWLSEKIAEL